MADDKDKMTKARELIKAKRYDEARRVLRGVKHPKAAEWLEKLPPPKRSKRLRVALIAIILIVAIGGLVLALQYGQQQADIMNQAAEDFFTQRAED